MKYIYIILFVFILTADNKCAAQERMPKFTKLVSSNLPSAFKSNNVSKMEISLTYYKYPEGEKYDGLVSIWLYDNDNNLMSSKTVYGQFKFKQNTGEYPYIHIYSKEKGTSMDLTILDFNHTDNIIGSSYKVKIKDADGYVITYNGDTD